MRPELGTSLMELYDWWRNQARCDKQHEKNTCVLAAVTAHIPALRSQLRSAVGQRTDVVSGRVISRHASARSLHLHQHADTTTRTSLEASPLRQVVSEMSSVSTP